MSTNLEYPALLVVRKFTTILHFNVCDMYIGLSFYQIFTILPIKNFYQFTGKFEW